MVSQEILMWVGGMVGEGEVKRNIVTILTRLRAPWEELRASSMVRRKESSGGGGPRQWWLGTAVHRWAGALGYIVSCFLHSQLQIYRCCYYFVFCLLNLFLRYFVSTLTWKEFLSLALKSDSPGSDSPLCLQMSNSLMLSSPRLCFLIHQIDY